MEGERVTGRWREWIQTQRGTGMVTVIRARLMKLMGERELEGEVKLVAMGWHVRREAAAEGIPVGAVSGETKSVGVVGGGVEEEAQNRGEEWSQVASPVDVQPFVKSVGPAPPSQLAVI